MQQLLLALLFLIPLTSYAHNGKTIFSYPMQNILVDGKDKEWEAVEKNYLKDDSSNEMAAFSLAYNVDEQALYFWVAVNDSEYQENTPTTVDWYLKDNLVLYFNTQHLENTATTAMLVLNQKGLEIVEYDREHQVLKEENITYSITKKKNKRLYEGKIKLGDCIKPFTSIGFDLLVVDANKGKETQYVSWAPGGSKQYLSGQLGDLVFLPKENKDFGRIKAQVKWKENIEEKLPSVVKIKSTEQPALWMTAAVDTAGYFEAKLPRGSYTIQSLFKLTSPMRDHGYDNQIRIDDNFKRQFTVEKDQEEDLGLIEFPTYKFPNYLIGQEGLLHDFDSSKIDAVKNFIKTTCAYYNIPGASVALIKEGKIVFHDVFGHDKIGGSQPITNTTVFQAASVTKPVFAFIVLRLVERNIIDLDKPLQQYLPFENIAHTEEYKKLTARHVLSHQSGLPNWAFGGTGGYAKGEKTDFLFAPGAKYGYSGEGFEYLGRVVEAVTKKDLITLLKEEVIDPLNIPDLYFCGNEGLHMANGHYGDGRPTYFFQPKKPGVAHSLLTEAHAFAHFVAALANKEGLSKETYAKLEERISTTDAFNSPENLYWNIGVSLGFFVQETDYGKAIMHGGNNGDFQAEFVLFTKDGIGMVVFTNSNVGHKLGQALGKFLFYGNK